MIFDGLSTFFGAASQDRAPDSDFWFTPLGYSSASGWVSSDRAMRSSAVFASVRVIAETVSSLPLITYRRLTRGKERATDHPMYRLLRWRPNEAQTALEFVEMMTAHAVLRGNGYAIRIYGRGGALQALVPVHPDRVRVNVLADGRVGYLVQDADGQQYRYTSQEMFHLRGLALDGTVGISPIGYAAQAIGMALAAEDYGARFYQNDATPGGVLTHPNHFRDKEMRDAFRKAWQEAQSGANRRKTAVLEDGMKYEQVGMTNTDAQFLESRKFQLAEIARIFRVPLVLLGETEKSTSWGTGIEQFMLAFVTHTIRPWCARWEQALQRDFFDDESADDEYFAEFLLDALLRGDQKTRYEAYSKGIQDGWMTRNEAREKENMNPLNDLDEPLEPLNMERTSERSQPPSSQPKDDPEDEEAAAARQVVHKEVAAARRAYEAHLGGGLASFVAWAGRFYGVHKAYLVKKLGVEDEFATAWCAQRRAELVQTAEQEQSDEMVPSLLDAWERDDGRQLAAKLRAIQ